MEDVYKTLAEQLKKPHGELAIPVAEKLNEVNETINLLSIEALAPEQGDTILEIGMSNAYFVKHIFGKQSDIHYTGCDYSSKMVYEANRINTDFVTAKKAEFLIADAASLPLENKMFDKVLVVATLYYFDDLELVFSEFRRVLRDSGKLIISIRPRSIMELYGTSGFADRMFSREELQDALTANGFRILTITEHVEPDIRILEEDIPSTCIIVVAEKS